MADLDQSGFGYQRVRTYLGPSLGWIDEMVLPSVEITTGGTYNVKPGDSLILVDVAAAVTIKLPDVVTWVQQPASRPATGFERAITVKDLGGNAANFNIVIAPFGQQAIDNIQQALLLATARANVKLIPLIDMSGWAVESSSAGSGGGGGGGGDVFKAGNNTFTGTNTFQNTVTVPTPAPADSSQNAASTAFVKAQNYLVSASLTGYALLDSPVFIGNPTAPTPAPADNDKSIATTEFVQTALAGFGGGAPINAEYITSSANATLSAERVLTNTASITWDFSVAGQARANSSAGGGNVSNTGTPVNGQIARWTTATTIEGINVSSLGFAPIASPVFTGDPQAPTPLTADNDTSIATTAYVKANLANFQPAGNYQPLDGDLTAISALLGTNTIYYRSATDIWSPVTFSGLSFSGGVLTVTAGGGNVNNSGTPTVDQIAVWTDATHIKGVAPSTLGGVGGQCRLIWTAATAITLIKQDGSKIKIQGVLYDIPAAGVSSPTVNVFIDGVSGQSLVVGNVYNVYVFNNSGTLTFDFSTTGHGVDTTAGNEGVEVKTGVPSRSLVGKVNIVAGPNFVEQPNNRGVLSWFNRRQRTAVADYAQSYGGGLTPAGTQAFFLTWGDEEVTFVLGGTTINNTVATNTTNVQYDNATFILNPGNQNTTALNGTFSTVAGVGTLRPTEGRHAFQHHVATNGGSCTWGVSTQVTYMG